MSESAGWDAALEWAATMIETGYPETAPPPTVRALAMTLRAKKNGLGVLQPVCPFHGPMKQLDNGLRVCAECIAIQRAPRREDATEPKTIDLMKVLTDSLKSPRREDAAGEREGEGMRCIVCRKPATQQDIDGSQWPICFTCSQSRHNLGLMAERYDFWFAIAKGAAEQLGLQSDGKAEALRPAIAELQAALSTAERERDKWRSVALPPRVTCRACQREQPFHEMYRCFQCQCWFDEKCMAQHLTSTHNVGGDRARVPSGGEEGR